jgi:hypothetical protein
MLLAVRHQVTHKLLDALQQSGVNGVSALTGHSESTSISPAQVQHRYLPRPLLPQVSKLTKLQWMQTKDGSNPSMARWMISAR